MEFHGKQNILFKMLCTVIVHVNHSKLLMHTFLFVIWTTRIRIYANVREIARKKTYKTYLYKREDQRAR